MSAAATSAAFPALGTTAQVFVVDPETLRRAREVLADQLDELDRACSRFRTDSELSRLNAVPETDVAVSPLLLEHVRTALRAASLTRGDVDPTVGRALRAIGYDRDFAAVEANGRVREAAPAGGCGEVRVDVDSSTIRLPRGVELDLGSTAKALAADRAAKAIHAELRTGVLVNLGGDLAIAGEPPPGGWRVRVTDDHRADETAPGQTIALDGGGLATSSVSVRSWAIDGRRYHHIVNPRTGRPADVYWRTVSVTAASCLDANIAATASIVRGATAAVWLAELKLPARLVKADGTPVRVAGWPEGGS